LCRLFWPAAPEWRPNHESFGLAVIVKGQPSGMTPMRRLIWYAVSRTVSKDLTPGYQGRTCQTRNFWSPWFCPRSALFFRNEPTQLLVLRGKIWTQFLAPLVNEWGNGCLITEPLRS